MKIKITESQLKTILSFVKGNINESEILFSDPVINDIKDRVIEFEGTEPLAYKDSLGILTIGHGFNLTRNDAKNRLKEIGADYNKVINKKQVLSPDQMEKLLLKDLKESKDSAKIIVKNFDQLPKGIQGVLVEMVYNMGAGKFKNFKNFISFIEKKDFKSASKEMLNSKWSKQVGDRSKTLADIVKSGGTFKKFSRNKNTKDVTIPSTELDIAGSYIDRSLTPASTTSVTLKTPILDLKNQTKK